MSMSIGLNKNSFPLTNAILPTWRNYQDLTTTQKVTKIFVDTFKTLLWIIPVVPFATVIIDFFSKKKVEPVATPPVSKENDRIYKPVKVCANIVYSAAIIYAIYKSINSFQELKQLHNYQSLCSLVFMVGTSVVGLWYNLKHK